jgi:membrane-bound inhibitor of C-type lysozyme
MGKSLVLMVVLGTAGALAGGNTAQYICAKGTRVQATYTGQQARVTVGGKVLQMTTARSASGARYVGDGYTWWTKGPNADLYRGTDPATLTRLDSCRER